MPACEIKSVIYMGQVIWGKLPFVCSWPGLVFQSDQHGLSEDAGTDNDDARVVERSSGKMVVVEGDVWVFWFGDHKISKMTTSRLSDFGSGFADAFKVDSKRGLYTKAVVEALQVVLPGQEWKGIPHLDILHKALHALQAYVASPAHVPAWLRKLLMPYDKMYLASRMNRKEEEEEEKEEEESDDECLIEEDNGGDRCFACRKREGKHAHPFLQAASLCTSCKMCCVLCGRGTEIFMCDHPSCHKSYCVVCMQYLYGEAGLREMRGREEWLCLLCGPSKGEETLARQDWRQALHHMFQPSSMVPRPFKKRMRVLSLFDGISTGKVVLEKLGIEVEEYFSSEVDEDALVVSASRHPSVIQLGDVCQLSGEKLDILLPIDLLIGGSPCNDLSCANPLRKELEPDSSGLLFLQFQRVLKHIQEAQGGQQQQRPLWWLFENVASMSEQCQEAISAALECSPAVHDAKYFSSQNRQRFFWGNLPDMYCPPQYLAALSDKQLQADLFPGRTSEVCKIRTVTTKGNSLLQGASMEAPVRMAGKTCGLWMPEVERVFGFPAHYTDVSDLPKSRRLRLIGKAWSVQLLTHLLSPLARMYPLKKPQ